MTIKAKYIKTIGTQTGEGKNGTWTKTSVLFEIADGNYPKNVAIDFWKDVPAFQEDAEYELHLNLESREYNGKWYSDIKCWKAEPLTPVNTAPAVQTSFNDGNDDDLPF